MSSAQAVRRVAKEWIPPRLLSLWRSTRRQAAPPAMPLPEWEYLGPAWPKAVPKRGWNDIAIAEAYAAKWPAFVSLMKGDSPLAVSHEKNDLFDLCVDGQTHWLTLAYVAARAARRSGQSISVLDFGGALGHTLVGLRALFPELQWRYYCHEVAAVCEVGRKLNPDAIFLNDDSWKKRRYDLVIASNVLHYFSDWRATLERLSQVASGSLWLSRVPVVKGAEFTFLQRHFVYGLPTQVVSWAFCERELHERLRSLRLELRRRFLVFSGTAVIPGAPEPPVAKGFLLDRGE